MLLLLAGQQTQAAGTWAALASAPPTGVNHAMVLSDGTIFTDNGSGNCCRLTPDIHGNYRSGTWTRIPSMNYSRLFFASSVLTNGNIFVAGGEYGTGRRHAELYDSLNNSWSKIVDPLPGPAFSDAIGKILPNGNVLVAPVSQFGGCVIYNAAANSWLTAPGTLNQNEVCWVKATNDTIVTIDTNAQTSEHYNPKSNQWIADGNVPVVIYGYGAELGAGFALPNGNIFFIGGSTNTAIYTPGPTPTSAGSWVAGPPMVFGANQLGAVDAPAAMMANGKILAALGPVGGFNSPTYFYEYDYEANAWSAAPAPGGGSSYNAPPFVTSMLCLPDGNILLVGGQNSQSLYIYTPDGVPLDEGKPGIYSIAENANGTYHMTGTNFNGISEGAAYGDDEQMDSNYPLVRMTNSVSGNVYFARTFNWNSTAIQTGAKVISTEFSLPQNLPAGTYSLVVVANGNPSAPTNFVYAPVSVPTGLTAFNGSNGLVRLSWNPVANATAYNLKRSPITNGYFTTIATLTGTTSYTNTGLTNGLTYYYKVAAVGTDGPSNDSAVVSGTPAGPSVIPGATPVNLAGIYNRIGIYSDGRTFAGGLDNSGNAFSRNLLGPTVSWNNLIFAFGPPNALDTIACAGQTINLPAGQFNTLQFLATAVNGSQLSQTFIVTYTDLSTATYTQSFSDWVNQSGFGGESIVQNPWYRNQGSGGTQATRVFVDGFVFTLDQTKTVQSITLPVNANLILMAMELANDPATVPLSSFYNRAGIYKDGTTYTNPATGGIDGSGYSYSGTLLGGSQTWSNTLFSFGPINATNVISCANQTIPLPAGNYSRLRMLGTAVNGNQPSQSFLVTYTDLTTSTFSQGLSDWFSPQNYAGETKAIPMGYRNSANGSSSENNSLYLYGYSFTLNPAKTVQSIRLPANANAIITAISLVPNWPPSWTAAAYTLANANAGVFYANSIAANASDLNGDTITFSKVSGPAWLTVGSNGALGGTPSNADANTNSFVVSARDATGASNTASLFIYVNGSPSFIVDPFSLPSSTAGQAFSGTIATNASDPNPSDTLTFGIVSGPAWLNVAADGSVSGTPQPADVGTNTFVVSVTDQSSLSGTATLNIPVAASSTPIISSLMIDTNHLFLSWTGGTGPFQVQQSTNVANPDWQNYGAPTSGSSVEITPSNAAAFYRIMGQ